ncbi:hypothetical protein DLAC_01377 [Tieghemostelium lacteum]|uniref:Translin n=1 Tax=Tieghemostelium lacteum TaxID=361077 RepID=A0A152A8H8_TIELA|nr:hypothetical protein DLAC_01377 [Tieghemostelium lacteum]|eukprot:KYR02532.1 hypothetical protein DLAC_01377 [Tieghemostelium lacteum]
MNNIFEKFTTELEEEYQTRQNIKTITQQIDSVERKLTLYIQNYHQQQPQSQDKPNYQQLLKELEPIKEHFGQLKTLIKPIHYYKYRDHWKQHLSQIVFCLTFSNWIDNKTLLKIDEIQTLLNLDKPGAGQLSIELEDYLLGLCNLSNEMSRYCVNCVIRQDYDTPLKISLFVSDLFSGFRLLNLKNDIIRKRYDSMKYDLKRIEEVVYDISVRNLHNNTSTSNNNNTSTTNTENKMVE